MLYLEVSLIGTEGFSTYDRGELHKVGVYTLTTVTTDYTNLLSSHMFMQGIKIILCILAK